MGLIELCFYGQTAPELFSCTFTHPSALRTMKSVRGKVPGAYLQSGSFQWTKSVRAFCLVALKALQHGAAGAVPFGEAGISGGRGSLAASLDYAIQKEPAWLQDMFGVDSRGRCLVRRLLERSNPGQKRSGPVALSWNCRFVDPSCIKVMWNDKELTSPSSLIALVSRIENQTQEFEQVTLAA